MAEPVYSCDITLRTFQMKEAEGPTIRCGKDLADAFKDALSLDREAFFVVTLNQKHRQIDRHLVSLGTLTAALVHPREAFRPALADAAAAVAFLHNHPSGDPTPSREDRELTSRLKEVGDLLGIPVLGHVIIGSNGFYSFAEEGLM